MTNPFDLLLPEALPGISGGVSLRFGVVTQASPLMVRLERDAADSYVNTSLVSIAPPDVTNAVPVLIAKNGDRLILVGRLGDEFAGPITSGANGSCVQFYNGLQICWLNRVTTNQQLQYAYGAAYLGYHLWTYAKPFIAGPVVVCTRFQYDTGASWPGGPSDTPGTASVTLRGIDLFQRLNTVPANCYIEAAAVGRWR